MQSILPAALIEQLQTLRPEEPVMCFLLPRAEFNQMMELKHQMSAEQWQQFAEWVEESNDGVGRSATYLMIDKHRKFIADSLR